MEPDRIIETRGLIIKEERVCSFTANTLNNTLVLENTTAFPGYFGKNIPDTGKPRSIFMVLERPYEGLFLARKLREVSEKMQHKCYGAFGKIFLHDATYDCIRIKNLDCFENIPKIQQAFIDCGIDMMKYRQINEEALIKIDKSFFITPITDEIFKDQFEPDRYYIKINSTLEWSDFKKITTLVRNNIENSLFDAAMGVIWLLDGPMEVVRVYDPKHDMAQLQNIHDRYEVEIKRWNMEFAHFH